MLNLFATTSKCLSDLSCHLSLLPITLAFLMKIIRLASSPVSLKLKFACGMGRTDFQFLSVSKDIAFPMRISLREVHWSPTAMQDTKQPPFSFVGHIQATMQCLRSCLFYVKK
jgi:hypothetical protein